MGLLRACDIVAGCRIEGGTTPLQGGGVFLGEEWDVLTR
jgi:hypothetical protein